MSKNKQTNPSDPRFKLNPSCPGSELPQRVNFPPVKHVNIGCGVFSLHSCTPRIKETYKTTRPAFPVSIVLVKRRETVTFDYILLYALLFTSFTLDPRLPLTVPLSCTLMCLFSWSGRGNRFSHPGKEHANGLSPVSAISKDRHASLKPLTSSDMFGQVGGFDKAPRLSAVPPCQTMTSTHLPQWEQTNGFSPLWVRYLSVSLLVSMRSLTM